MFFYGTLRVPNYYYRANETYLISESFGVSLGSDVRDIDDNAPGADVDIDAQVEELVQCHDQPRVMLLRVHLHRELMLVSDLQDRQVFALKYNRL